MPGRVAHFFETPNANSPFHFSGRGYWFWRPQGDSNPRRRRERAVSWARLDDRDLTFKSLREMYPQDATYYS